MAGQLGTYYIHSTRHAADDGVAAYGAFEEAHSHATSHQLLPTSRAALDLADTVILVDDELSTGATIVNTIRELHNTAPHRRYIIASLVDLRSAADRGIFDDLALELGARISSVALADGSIRLPETLAADAADLIGRLPPAGDGRRHPRPRTGRPPRRSRCWTCTASSRPSGARGSASAGGLIRSRRPVSPPPSRIHRCVGGAGGPAPDAGHRGIHGAAAGRRCPAAGTAPRPRHPLFHQYTLTHRGAG